MKCYELMTMLTDIPSGDEIRLRMQDVKLLAGDEILGDLVVVPLPAGGDRVSLFEEHCVLLPYADVHCGRSPLDLARMITTAILRTRGGFCANFITLGTAGDRNLDQLTYQAVLRRVLDVLEGRDDIAHP